MQRVTLTLDDDLLAALDALSARRGYHNRSEAVRDILRDALNQILRRRNHGAGMPSCRTCMNMKNANWRAGWWPPSIIITISPSPRCMCISVMTTAGDCGAER